MAEALAVAQTIEAAIELCVEGGLSDEDCDTITDALLDLADRGGFTVGGEVRALLLEWSCRNLHTACDRLCYGAGV